MRMFADAEEVDMDVSFTEARRRVNDVFPTREQHLLWQLTHYAMTGQAFDATFYDREPILEVTLAPDFAREFSRAVSLERHKRLARLLREIRFSDGSTASVADIWTLNYMPHELVISDVDLSAGEQQIGDGGETMREIIGITYRCRSRAEEDFFLARFVAS
jgi:hypothetical protein